MQKHMVIKCCKLSWSWKIIRNNLDVKLGYNPASSCKNMEKWYAIVLYQNRRPETKIQFEVVQGASQLMFEPDVSFSVGLRAG